MPLATQNISKKMNNFNSLKQYEEYIKHKSLEELFEIKNYINREEFPERYQVVSEVIKSKQPLIDEVNKNQNFSSELNFNTKQLLISILILTVLSSLFVILWNVNYSGNTVGIIQGEVIDVQYAGKLYSLSKVKSDAGEILYADCPEAQLSQKVVLDIKKGVISGKTIFKCR